MVPLKINEVEALVGITKKNIRFYEEKGLLSPSRNSDNGYRDYGEEEVAEHEITERYVRRLESMIRERPELWMWSHRRWKHKRE